MWKVVLLGGCSSRVLGDLLHKSAVLGAMSGSRAEGTHIAAPTAVGVQKTKTWLGQPKQNYCHKRETRSINLSCKAGSALFTRSCAHAHVFFMVDTCTEAG